MTSQSTLESFKNSWNQTAAWAQSRGIKYNQYFPVYQMDSQRLLQYNAPMSTAERERAVLAAANPGQAAQSTPSTAGNPGNVVGNTINDLRNIFTGVGDIAIHPLHNGLVDSVKNTFDLLDGDHKLTGGNDLEKLGDALTSTVLSWVPGAADVGTVLQAGGLEAGLADLADHPISSILDVLPIAKPLAFASDVSEAGAAARVGMDLDTAKSATVGRVLKGYIMNTPTSKVGPQGLMTVGDRWEALKGASVLGTNKAIGDAAYGTEAVTSHYTTEERMVFADAENSTKDLTTAQMEELHQVFDPTSRVPIDQRIENTPDPLVRQAAKDLQEGPLRFHREEVLAADEITLLTDPKTGATRIYSTTDHDSVVKARDAYTEATKTLMEKMPELEQDAQFTQAAEQLISQHSQALQQANEQARQVSVEGNFQKELPGMKRLTGMAKQSSVNAMFGEGGFIDSILHKVQTGQFEDVVSLAESADRKLSTWEERSVDAASDPAFQAVKTQVDQLGQAAKAALEIRKRSQLKVYGKAVKWFSGKRHRDEMARDQSDALKQAHTDQRAALRSEKTRLRQKLKASFAQKNKEIRTRYDRDIAEQRAKIKAGTQDINEKFELEKAKATTAHLAARETHQAWLSGKRAQGEVIPTDYIRQQEKGYAIHEGMPGSKTAEIADHARLEAEKQTYIKMLVDSFPPEKQLLAQMQVELRDSALAEQKMLKSIDQQFNKDSSALGQKQKMSKQQLDQYHEERQARNGTVTKAYQDWNAARKAFSQQVWAHPPDVFTDIYFDTFSKHLLEHEHSQELLSKTQTMLADKHGWGKEQIDALRKNGQVLTQLAELGVRGAFEHPIFTDMDQQIIQDAVDSARNEVRRLMDEGLDPQYLPHISTTQIRADETGSYGIRLLVGHGIPKPDAASARTWDLNQSRYDIMAGIHRGVKQVLDRDATIDYVDKYLSPRVVKSSDLLNRVVEFFPKETAGLHGQALLDFVNAKAVEWGLVKFDPKGLFGFSMPKWGSEAQYLDGSLVKAVQKLTERGALPSLGTFDKLTRLFRYSILGLSPRYTAHILFGGSFLLALRSSPFMVTMLKQAHDMTVNGELPEELSTHATNLGTTEYTLRQLGDAMGKNQGHLMMQEHIELRQKVKLAAAQPIHWLKAAADLNLRFTGYIVNLQRAVAFLDGAAKAEKIEGMTAERAMYEGMHHATEVMGDLRRMSPFERMVARSVVPFYGWEKHILQYVLSFPADHPWRAMMLSQMAEYDTSHEQAGLPSRYQFLFFLGTPDAQGNVSVLDFRAMNPLRDVANYATLGGLISSLNPVVSSAFAMVDPSITYGENQLYPNLTYDQFYGIETAPPQGNLLTAIEGVVPQVSAIQSAMNVASAARGANTSSELKNIYESLNIPMFQVQHINLRQEAAKTALARYQVTKSLATTAWETGNFQPISDLGSVPDPRNADYETPVSELEQLYAQLSKEYPGTSPDEVAPPLPTVHL